MATWEEIGAHWHRAQQMGWQAIQAALDVGDELNEKKQEYPKKNSSGFVQHAVQIGISRVRAYELIRLALHRQLIEANKPESMREALRLLPKKPPKTKEEKIDEEKKKIDEMEAFISASVKKKLDILLKKHAKVVQLEMQNEARDFLIKEMKALKRKLKLKEQELEKERETIIELRQDAAEKRQFYQDLINAKFNGYDVKKAIRLLRQAIATDREMPSVSVRTKAMQELTRFAKLFGV